MKPMPHEPWGPDSTQLNPADSRFQQKSNVMLGLVIANIILTVILVVALIYTQFTAGKRIDTLEKIVETPRNENEKIASLTERVDEIDAQLQALDDQVQDNVKIANDNADKFNSLDTQVQKLSDQVAENAKIANENSQKTVDDFNDLVDKFNDHLTTLH